MTREFETPTDGGLVQTIMNSTSLGSKAGRLPRLGEGMGQDVIKMDKGKKNGIQRLLSALFSLNDRKTKPSQESTILVARAGQLGFAHRVGHDTTPPANYKMCIALVGPQDNPVIHDILIQQGWLVYNYATNTSYVHELLHEVLQCMGATPGQIDYIGKISFQGCKEMELKGYPTRAYLVRQEEHLLNHNPLKEIMPFRKGEKA